MIRHEGMFRHEEMIQNEAMTRNAVNLNEVMNQNEEMIRRAAPVRLYVVDSDNVHRSDHCEDILFPGGGYNQYGGILFPREGKTLNVAMTRNEGKIRNAVNLNVAMTQNEGKIRNDTANLNVAMTQNEAMTRNENHASLRSFACGHSRY